MNVNSTHKLHGTMNLNIFMYFSRFVKTKQILSIDMLLHMYAQSRRTNKTIFTLKSIEFVYLKII